MLTLSVPKDFFIFAEEDDDFDESSAKENVQEEVTPPVQTSTSEGEVNTNKSDNNDKAFKRPVSKLIYFQHQSLLYLSWHYFTEI